jgi:hypothetical protein
MKSDRKWLQYLRVPILVMDSQDMFLDLICLPANESFLWVLGELANPTGWAVIQ